MRLPVAAFVEDLRMAVRSLCRTPGYTSAAVFTLALGFGAVAAAFTVVNTVILRPLPFVEPERLVQLYGRSALFPERDSVTGLDAYRRASTSFEQLVGYSVDARYRHDGPEAERVMTVSTERDFFVMLAVPAAMGRTFHAADPSDVVVVADRFWRTRLGGDPEVLGRTLVLDGRSFTILGVMPEAFQFPYAAASRLPGVSSEAQTDVWVPLDLPLPPRSRFATVTGRLKRGVPIEAARRELDVISASLAADDPQTHHGRSVLLEPLTSTVVLPSVRHVLLLLSAGASVLLAMMCANVAGLVIARASARASEWAVRSALGASRSRLVRQFIAESTIVSLAGMVAGCVLALWGATQVIGLAAPYLPRTRELALDWRVVLFLASSCTAVAVAVGAVPALTITRPDRSLMFTTAGHAAPGPRERRVRDILVVAEIALAFLLAVAATVLLRELVRIRNTGPGLRIANVLTVHVGERMTPETDVGQFYEIEARVRQLAGVRSAGFTQLLPLQNWGWTSSSTALQVVGRASDLAPYPIELRYVTPGYFEALGIAIVAGRTFGIDDAAGRPPVVVINEALARRHFAGVEPVGQLTNRGQVVGVVGDVRQTHLDRQSVPELYFPAAQNWSQVSELGMTLVVNTVGPPESMIEPVHARIREVNPRLAVFDAKSMERVVADSLSDFTLSLGLVALFALLSLLMAIVGTYGVTAFRAVARTREFAIRVALGARHGRIARLVWQDGLRLASAGLALGLLFTVALGPLLGRLPISVRAPDAVTMLPVAGVVLILTIAACAHPARRASRVDPIVTLKTE